MNLFRRKYDYEQSFFSTEKGGGAFRAPRLSGLERVSSFWKKKKRSGEWVEYIARSFA